MQPQPSPHHPKCNGHCVPGQAARRSGRARDLKQCLHAKNTTCNISRHSGKFKRRRRRNAALAFTIGVMGLGTALHAAPYEPPPLIKVNETKKRKRVTQLRVSDTLKEALIEEEGVRLTVYRDVAGNPTVGVGHLVDRDDGLKVGDTVSYEEVLEFLEEDLRTAEIGVARLVGELPLHQHEFDALVDLVYNVGEGTVSARKSPRLNAAIAAGDYYEMAEELDYTKAAGSRAGGLVHRSERRSRIFMNASYENTRGTSESVAAEGGAFQA